MHTALDIAEHVFILILKCHLNTWTIYGRKVQLSYQENQDWTDIDLDFAKDMCLLGLKSYNSS